MEGLRYVRILVYAGIFLIPFTALIVADWLYFPFITGKNFTFRLLVELMFGLWVIVALYEPQFRPKKVLALMLGGLFVVAIGISTLLAENPTKALWSNFERMEGYVMVLHLAAYVVVLTSMLRTEELWKRFFQVTLGVSLLVGIYALFQLGGALTINQGGVRVDGTLGNATYFAAYMLIHAFLALYAVMRFANGNRMWQALYGALFVLDVVLVFYSATRGSILGLVGGLFLAGAIFLVMGKGRVRQAGIGVVAIVIVLASIFFTVKDSDFVRSHPVLERIASISLSEGNTRFAIWGMAYQGFLERPIFGWGQEGFNYLFNKYYEPKLYTQEPWFDRAHNVFIDWLVAGGIVGALLYLSLYFVLLYYLWRPGNTFEPEERAILTGLIAAYGFHNLLVFDNLLSYVMFFAIFSYITVRGQQGTSDVRGASDVPGARLDESTWPIAAPIVIVVTLAVVYLANASGYATARGLISGLQPQPEGLEKNLQYFIDASKRGGLGHQEAGEQFLQFALQVKAMNIGSPDFQLAAATQARDAFQSVLLDAPTDARLLVFFGSFLRQFGDMAGARDNLTRALLESPEKQSILNELGVLEYSEGNFDAALSIFEKVYATAPNFGQTAVFYASTAIAAGKNDVASKVLIDTFGTDEPIDAVVFQAYLTAGQFEKAVRIAEARVAAEPTSVAALKMLAGAYLEARQLNRAIQTLEKAIALDPTFKAEGESYIRDIQSGNF